MSSEKKRFNQIVRDIKSVKIQGAKNIALAAVKAYFLLPSQASKKALLASRPTEPMMKHVLDLAEKGKTKKEILSHFDFSEDKINKSAFKLIKARDKIFTHCHSSSVLNALIYAKKKGKKFEVLNTETRPLYQGRKTAKALAKAKIKVTMFSDSAAALAIEKENKKDSLYANKVFFGADALLPNGVINKVGSYQISKLSYESKIPVYILADSWKFTREKIVIEQRPPKEIWETHLKNLKIKNPAFDFVPKKYIKGIISEFGLMTYDKFVKKCRNPKKY